MKVMVEHHGLAWWKYKGIRCPDCDTSDKLKYETEIGGLAKSTWDLERRPYGKGTRTKHTAWIRCDNCNAIFKVEEYDD